MINFSVWIPGLLGGLLIGVFFFGGLRWTVEQLPRAKRPALLFVFSFFGRTILTLLGFYIIAAGSWQRLLIAAVAFLVARVLIVNLTAPRANVASEVNEAHGTQS